MNLKIRQWKLESQEQKEKKNEAKWTEPKGSETLSNGPTFRLWEFKEKREKRKQREYLKNG